MSLTPTEKAVAEERKYMELAILNQQNSVANVSNLPKSKSIITPITKEMIQDYKDTLEAYGKKGGERLYEIPDVALTPFNPLPELSQDAKRDLEAYGTELNDDINKGNELLVRIDGSLRELQDYFNDGQIIEADYTRDRDHLMELRLETIDKIRDDEAYLEAEIQRIETLQQNELQNKAEKQRIDVLNKEKLRVATETAKMYNSELKLESQGPNESNEEYTDRIANLKNIVQPEIIKDDAEILVMRKFNNNMMELIRNKAIITQVLQLIGVPQAFEINKIFPLFKKRFLEIYGYNNKGASAELIADAIVSLLNKDIDIDNYQRDEQLAKEISENFRQAGRVAVETVRGMMGKPEKEPEKKPEKKQNKLRRKLMARKKGAPEAAEVEEEEEEEEEDEEEEPEEVIGMPRVPVYDSGGIVDERYVGNVFNQTTEEGLYFIKYIPPKQKAGRTARPIFMYSDSGMKDSFKKVDQHNIKKIVSLLQMSQEEIIGNLNSQQIEPIREDAIYKRGSTKHLTSDITGWGIKPENIPASATFGRIMIKPRKLYYNNMLVLKDHKGGNIKSFPNMAVSDLLVKLLFKVLKNENIAAEEIKHLDTSEQNLYNLIIRIAELHKKLPNTGRDTINELKQQLELIEGEIEAGNNNPKLLKDAKKICDRLFKFGVISAGDAKNYIKQLNN